ncbi:glycyl-radical enzyme activating protein [Enterococcus hulanensis]|uniref:Glycyl-radical enzyme activating protein n=1 Tax=Enterococcus hulanensis TaxID=2559929 RepID=A0ABU3EYN0_9ENTE|nr:glycyl-radical enzyme activating protein [Enterococcus hulanensis]MDT2599980.1 glycyl-radical enzyme activating protein [Enterococcus hulanensis]MDT2610054.1 glycyl-radical enzyme activating protein [Enterococcus hulanensis]MDT2617862.1 glycyl-radical enzyme activating protein [Enterococcus hulanensis]MDT2629832.1 glycyl-radical enzyme activating protein [Enterococcus hulanensis]MDT2656427.1 glycyl-radical enzyme activating protein [Enterococcus hulanensis]
MDQGLVFNIQRYSVHDGGGIRTLIFLKGCPLRCPWCSNPESRKKVEPTTWKKNGKTEQIGAWRSIDELLDEVLKDEIFYRTSGGGVTLSGGEVLMQSEFASAFLQELKKLGIHTAIETTGCFSVTRIKRLTPYVDQVLFDLKIMDRSEAKKVIGVDSETVRENFEYLLTQEQIQVIPRIPLIPEYTTNEKNIQQLIDFLTARKIGEVHLLPFHQYGSSKYDYLGREYRMKDVQTLTRTEIDTIKAKFERAGIRANIDGLE